jgi:ABC-type transporter Mla MlaB component
MQERYKITTESNPGEQGLTLVLKGKFSEDALSDLEQSLAAARKSSARIYLDLSEVTLVDRKAARYFSQQAARDVKLVNCPVYLKSWLPKSSEDLEN